MCLYMLLHPLLLGLQRLTFEQEVALPLDDSNGEKGNTRNIHVCSVTSTDDPSQGELHASMRAQIRHDAQWHMCLGTPLRWVMNHQDSLLGMLAQPYGCQVQAHIGL